MDPTVALTQLIEAACTGKASVVEDSAGALIEWLGKGGFPPDPVAVEDWLNNWNAEREAPGASDRLRAGL